MRLLGFSRFTRRYTTRDATQFRYAWAPHTQTQRHGVLAMMTTGTSVTSDIEGGWLVVPTLSTGGRLLVGC